MEFSKKFVLVPEGSKHVPSDRQISDFDKEMLKVLNSTLNDYEKVRKYYELLQNKMKMEEHNTPWVTTQLDDLSDVKNMNEEIPIKDKKESFDYTTVVLNGVPPVLKKQASSLLQLIKKDPSYFKWNEKGELSIKGQTLPNSNLADLFNLIFTNRKNYIQLVGKDEFLKALADMNVPHHYIKNKNIRKLTDVIEPEPRRSRRSIRKRKPLSRWLSLK